MHRAAVSVGARGVRPSRRRACADDPARGIARRHAAGRRAFAQRTHACHGSENVGMTWSIIARDPSGAYGVAVASKFFAVGAICPHGEGGVGALSTQALPNPLWGYRGMRLLREGMPAQAVVDHLVTPDKGAGQRQLHVHDAAGGIAVHTGARCIDWCGHVVRPAVSVAGNMLAGPDVVAATAHAFETSKDKSFARRLIAALAAGEAAGGAKPGHRGGGGAGGAPQG